MSIKRFEPYDDADWPDDVWEIVTEQFDDGSATYMAFLNGKQRFASNTKDAVRAYIEKSKVYKDMARQPKDLRVNKPAPEGYGAW